MRILLRVVWFFLLVGLATCALPEQLSAAQESDHHSAITVSLKPSRSQVAVGTAYGITAVIKNVSNDPIWMNTCFMTMTAPRELDPNGPEDWYAVVPFPGKTPNTEKNCIMEKLGGKSFALLPGSEIPAFWTANEKEHPNGREDKLIQPGGGILAAITFSPGKYNVQASVAYWDNKNDAEAGTPSHGSETSNLDVDFVASQRVILLGAVVGGLIAYILLRRKNLSRPHLNDGWRSAGEGVLTAILLAPTITVLLARVPDAAAFNFVKVNVGDFWGALAVGFLASASGTKILQKLSGASPTERRPQD